MSTSPNPKTIVTVLTITGLVAKDKGNHSSILTLERPHKYIVE